MRDTKRIEDIYLNYLRRSNIEVSFQMADTRRIKALIVAFDQNSIVIDVNGTQQLLYKTQIAQIEPEQVVSYIFNDRYLPDHSYMSAPYTSHYT
ncbi:MAG TPA: RNA chaperone Hfq [Clostridiaceae bacterium]|nr:RNA chaperone Hfq [Clostridiaceae bacterium]